MRRLVLYIILATIMCTLSAHKYEIPNVEVLSIRELSIMKSFAENKVDSLGRKDGYWCEGPNPRVVNFIDYSNGKRSGLRKVYEASLHNESIFYLGLIAHYCNDKPVGPWFYYYLEDNRHLVVDSISFNYVSPIHKEYLAKFDYDTTNMDLYMGQCYYVDYKNEKKVSEGWWIFYDEDIEGDGQEVGTWRFYDSIGNVSIKEFKDKLIIRLK